ncbi:MAG: PEBP family protein, partial [Actinobacteria bacterium]|nr:PEBP family protein [Candidatus Fonsibacter lacus]
MRNKTLFIIALFAICLSNAPHAVAVSAKTISFKAEIWADNWFALYINGKKVGEDSVSI